MRKVIPLLVLLVALGYSFFQLYEKKEAESKVTSNNDAYIASIQKLGVQVGQQAPDIQLMTLDEKKVNLSSFKGKKVILNFWATWCPPCQDEIPALEKFHQAHKDIEMIGVADYIGEKKDLNFIKNFVSKNSMNYNILIDENGDNFRKYGVISIPTTYFINANGEIVFKQIGPVTEKQLNTFLK
ncbi:MULTISPECIES: TlpA disulfide reductase family protein [unclassified Bacillus (in: firmicutes)]|uniref:TlpA family protein disulfide reductase n=1 Tax=Bacillaceae TaxID=186817 RepID=UPI000BEF989B|nr:MULTISPECIES: TlpA disulfide reductase family protein [unclassified Bacillus (in: firmicutes)]PEJ57220.1 thiol:disulfide interchange protein [Bacillus sp. AFS002410]PEL12639.1 thiol:disulfide interchange protein [Bacillus sp. AFS017336]